MDPCPTLRNRRDSVLLSRLFEVPADETDVGVDGTSYASVVCGTLYCQSSSDRSVMRQKSLKIVNTALRRLYIPSHAVCQ